MRLGELTRRGEDTSRCNIRRIARSLMSRWWTRGPSNWCADSASEIVTSANLIQYFEARWTKEQLESHLEAGRRIDRVRREAFERIGAKQRAGERVTEWDIKQFILDRYKEDGIFIDHGPDVAVNANASNPHYDPTKDSCSEIQQGRFCADRYVGETRSAGQRVLRHHLDRVLRRDGPPDEMQKCSGWCARRAIAAIDCVKKAVAAKQELRGFEVDDAARSYIREQGFGGIFLPSHRAFDRRGYSRHRREYG